jgi:hypothetical protein
LLGYFEAIQSLTVRHAPMLEQLVLSEFIAEGHFGRHLRRMRKVYAERLSVLLEEARVWLSGLLEISNLEAGLQTVGWLCNGIDAESAAAAAAKRKVDVTPLDRYSQGQVAPNGLQLGFAALDVKALLGVLAIGSCSIFWLRGSVQNVTAIRSLWGMERGCLVCHWSGVGQRVPYNPSWMRDASDAQGSYLPPVPDFASHSPFGGPSWFERYTSHRDR